ncbi:Rieske 2Fe-2S domain-containing protein [Mycobacteroides abscessus subsp. abscessus]|uniref:Rieske 2Fe-2S domain-containing protein n=1 Tax=Mycobacteroides abscessus TaxID=36809 RepID=UPI00266D0011|nr:Rieske 2Fe-2S domain-containing protein [Mycobacteroides abscessus]MDO3014678.1 Rieske 2Fe-2S domain-containing protein [Mycobacteroides abscessus subsp. abscessus]
MSADADGTQVRHIEKQIVSDRFARGWHCLGLAQQFGDGKPHGLAAFGQKLVIFRGKDGQLNVLDAYCRHMGGDLSKGEIKGDEIACPFHDWRWGADGRCKQVPYSRRVPRLARTSRWVTQEQDGMLFVWNDPEGNPPPPEVAIPKIDAIRSDDWTEWRWYTMTVDANCREIIDNVVDMAHFYYVHGGLPTQFINIFEGHVATQSMTNGPRPDHEARDGVPTLLGTSSIASYYGPSFMIDYLTYHYEHEDQETILLNCHYPIDAHSFVLHYAIMAKKSAHLPAEAAEHAAAALGDFIRVGFEQDVEIWRSKASIDNPLLCEEDGPVYQLRRWYQQFYVDVDQITPDMTDRFEYEVDTTRSHEIWVNEIEAAANNGARAAAQ